MPANNLIHSQLDPGQLQSCINQLTIVKEILLTFSRNLSAEERQQYGRINEQNKLLVSKVLDYRHTEPGLSSPDVDWNTYEQSWASRSGYAQLETLCEAIIDVCSDPRILHDYYLYQNALIDYDYSKYKANSSGTDGSYKSKVEDIKQLFPNPTGHNSSPAAE